MREPRTTRIVIDDIDAPEIHLLRRSPQEYRFVPDEYSAELYSPIAEMQYLSLEKCFRYLNA